MYNDNILTSNLDQNDGNFVSDVFLMCFFSVFFLFYFPFVNIYIYTYILLAIRLCKFTDYTATIVPRLYVFMSAINFVSHINR